MSTSSSITIINECLEKILVEAKKDHLIDEEKNIITMIIPHVQAAFNIMNKPVLPEGKDALVITEDNATAIVNDIMYNLKKVHEIEGQLYPRISIVKGKAIVEVLKKLSDTSPLFKAEVELGGYIVFPVKVKSKYE